VLFLDERPRRSNPISTGPHSKNWLHDVENDYTIVIVTHNMQQAARRFGLHGVMISEKEWWESAGPTGSSTEEERGTEGLNITGRFGGRGRALWGRKHLSKQLRQNGNLETLRRESCRWAALVEVRYAGPSDASRTAIGT